MPLIYVYDLDNNKITVDSKKIIEVHYNYKNEISVLRTPYIMITLEEDKVIKVNQADNMRKIYDFCKKNSIEFKIN